MKIKIILSGKETSKSEILEKVVEQGKIQGLRYRKFRDFADALFTSNSSLSFEIVKKHFDVEFR